jgi:hypothetical protein
MKTFIIEVKSADFIIIMCMVAIMLLPKHNVFPASHYIIPLILYISLSCSSYSVPFIIIITVTE